MRDERPLTRMQFYHKDDQKYVGHLLGNTESTKNGLQESLIHLLKLKYHYFSIVVTFSSQIAVYD